MSATVSGLARIERLPGTYALVCRSSQEGEIAVGRLGALPVRRGYYVYVGSAFGPGGVRARVGRHVDHGRSRHWHIDYLRPALGIREIWYSHDPVRREHQWFRVLRQAMDCLLPLRRFGASDCRCEAHLAFFPQLPSFGAFREHVRIAMPDHDAIRRAPVSAVRRARASRAGATLERSFATCVLRAR